ncbi:MAG: hypothetical protein SNJ71_02085 [Bacteroidales bacterium]
MGNNKLFSLATGFVDSKTTEKISSPLFGKQEKSNYNNLRYEDFICCSAGEDFSIIVNKRGDVFAYGANYYGECNVPNMPPIIKVKSSSFHTIALSNRGTVHSWGWLNPPIDDDIEVIDVACCSGHNVTLDRFGNVRVYGNSQLMQPPSYVKDVRYIDAQLHSILAISNDEIIVWGNGPFIREKVKNVVSAHLMRDDVIILKSDGTLSSLFGQRYKLENIVFVSTSEISIACLDVNGKIFMLGEHNDYNQLCPPDGEGFSFVSISALHGLAIKSGIIYSWGLVESYL